MGKKNQTEWHTGKKSWWDGSVTTTCGQKIPAKEARRKGWFDSGKWCADCEAGRKHKH